MNLFTINVSDSGSEFQLKFKYDKAFIDALKIEVPSFSRAWDNNSRSWLLDPDWYKEVDSLVWYYFKFHPSWPQVKLFRPDFTNTSLELQYIGNTKGDPDRANKRASSGTTDGIKWDYIFWEVGLANWFTGVTPSRPKQQTKNFYNILEIPEDYPSNQLLTVYRKMAMKKHPDVNHAPDATQQFQDINEAYTTLSNPLKRARYDIGLKVEKEEMLQTMCSSRDHYSNVNQYNSIFKPPVRCGRLNTRGYKRIGRFYITEITEWNDIVDQQGRTLVTRWDMSNKRVVQEWYYS